MGFLARLLGREHAAPAMPDQRSGAAMPAAVPPGQLRMRVESTYEIRGRGIVCAGTIESGEVAVGDELFVELGGIQVPGTCAGLERSRKLIDRASAGEEVGLLVTSDAALDAGGITAIVAR